MCIAAMCNFDRNGNNRVHISCKNGPETEKISLYSGMAYYLCYFSSPKITFWHYKLKFKKNNTIMAKKTTVTPLHDRVIVKPAAAEEKTAGGIIIPDTAKEKPQRGTVVAAGPGKKDEPVTVKPGDTVLYGKYAGTEIQIGGEDLLIMRESDILAIV
ncbi:co-chaperone GroES [Niabella pedocola]